MVLCAHESKFSWDVVIQQLAQQNFTAWLPTIVRQQSFQGGKKLITEQPLFPSYIFVKFDIDSTRWHAVNHTVGVVRLLPERLERPQALPPAFIAGLQTRAYGRSDPGGLACSERSACSRQRSQN